MKLAIVDDNKLEQELIFNTLRTYEHERNISLDISSYSDGNSFLNTYVPGDFDLIFMDIYLNELNGIDIVRKIRQMDSKVMIVFLTTSKEYIFEAAPQTKIYCRQPAVNAILSHYDLLCAQDKIKTKFAVDFPTLSPISSVDFCIVLGNLLENAYLECKTLQKYEKFIHLKARQTSPGAFVLLIENPYEHEIKKTDSGFFLSSRRKNCVGTGLKSVTAICKKYDGHLSIETDNHRFKVKMFLQC